MKKQSFLIITTLFLSLISFAQDTTSDFRSGPSIRLNLYGAYAFDDSFDSYYDYENYYEGTLQGGFIYGGGIEYELARNSFIELSYQRLDTNAPTRYYAGGLFDQYADFDVAANYIMLGGNRSFRKPGAMIEGFGGLSAGMAIVNIENPNTGNSDNLTKFAWGMKAGAIVWASDKVGIKLQGQLLSVTQSVGGGIYFGTGGGGAGVSSYSTFYQFTLGGGLVFDLAN
jgi:hypothetical protein